MSDFVIPVSEMAKRTVNPIRQIVDQMEIKPHPDKPMIALSIGDPTVFGNMKVDASVKEAIKSAVDELKSNGYPPSIGYEHARQAVAEKYTEPEYGVNISSGDVIIASACSGAIDLAIAALLNPGQNVLVPRPGFSLYQTLAESQASEVKHYDLIPEKGWEIDLKHLESLIDDKTAAIIVTNPSNPCGSVFSKEHIRDVISVASKHKLPIIADEIYADMTFKDVPYISFASQSKDVPILSCGGIAKRYLVPGWRLGWVIIHDRNNRLGEVRQGLVALSQRLLGANSIVQAALPNILHKTPQSFYDETMGQLEENVNVLMERLSKVDGLKPIKPSGAMYLMVGVEMTKFPEFKDDFELVQRMITEQSVFCLPGRCFTYPGYFRIVVSPPKDRLIEACDRIEEFCKQHRK
eukprot:Clim_evm18s147 gene=Clim_evmTU18s147